MTSPATLTMANMTNWRPRGREQRVNPQAQGQVESLAVWILRARESNYFKWQLANRLGRISRRLEELSEHRAGVIARKEAVEQYLAAGLNHSFVEYPSPRNRFQRRTPTPLDLNPSEVVDHLESQMEMDRGGNAESL